MLAVGSPDLILLSLLSQILTLYSTFVTCIQFQVYLYVCKFQNYYNYKWILVVFFSQLDYPKMVEGIVLININPCAEGWMDWAAQKVIFFLNNSTHNIDVF